MAVQENGYVPAVSQEPRNGSPVGKDMKSEKVRRKSPLRWTLGLVVRLCIWYTLLTPFLRCPSRLDELNETSPKVCKPYLIARSHVEPYVTPYYDTYAAPYVDQARPYVEVFNQQVYTPASNVAKFGYEKYGAPAWQQARTFSEAQWKAQVTPRLEAAQVQAHQLYLAQVDPYVQQGVSLVSPYYQKANGVAQAVYWNQFVPFYTRSQPFIGKTYSTGQQVLITHVMPGARYTWSSVVYFANSSLWPHVTGLYSEQVEPQLVKIGQRLASYREGKRLRAVVEEMDSSSSAQTASSTVTTAKVEPRTSAGTTTTTTSTPETPSAKPTLSAEEQSKQARARIESDLQRWQEKFAKAADKGIEDLEERIGDIVSALIVNSANSHGESLSTALQAVSAEKISSIKERINELAAALPEEDAPEEEEEASDKLLTDIRTAAVSVRDRAHALRQWSLSFDEELLRRVSAAINSTLDVLDSIRDLGLQEIGTRWAWMDDVTYKDWAKYHALKVQIDDWRNEIRKVGMNHKSIAEAQSVAAGILDIGMEVAEDTAKELIRLKDVGNWKIAAREVGDNFETRTEAPPPRPKPVVETEEYESTDNDEVFEEATTDSETSSSISQEDDTEETPVSTPNEDSFDEVEESIESETFLEGEDVEERVSDAIFEDETFASKPAFGVAAATLNTQQEPILDDDEQDALHSLASKAGDVYSDASSAFADSTSQAKILYEIAKSQVMGQMAQSSAPAHAQVLSSIESAYSGAVKYATEEFEARIGAIKATPTSAGPLAHISSVASSRLSEGLSLASEQLALYTIPATTSVGSQPFVLDAQRRYYEAVGVAHDHYTAFVSTASVAVYGTPTPTPAPLNFQNLLEQAGSQYEQASSLASASLAAVVASASSMISAADDGRSQSIIDDASSRYHAALSAASSSLSLASASASSAIYGTTPGPLESLSSQASENWEILVSKASEQIYGTPAPYLQQVVDNHVPQLEAVQAIVSELLIGKQPSFTESVLSKLRVAYETPYPAAAVSAASSYASVAYEAVSSATHAVVSDIPSVEDIMQQANDQLQAAVEAASVGIYGTAKGRFEQATEAAAEAYSSASSQISDAVYGKEPSYIEIAKDNIAQIQSKASAAIHGEEPGAFESATSRLAAAVESAQAQLADLASSASSVASEAVETAVSHADQITSSIKAGASSQSKDEL
ncbi:uncharacterized protein N7496_008773 [Penicillium cataractarum]|uniref:Transcription factor hoxa13 n=1 Tax=Penicillium cataractarum TaxID=2100454 RepID=A0A9W9S3P1_9EURO|nr:uncharacterized protein N7496_008773 [Penicillium cataractarum]KAJ5369013.1 hypothetical protein N7496_008773 [Penicillium cataractarum]